MLTIPHTGTTRTLLALLAATVTAGVVAVAPAATAATGTTTASAASAAAGAFDTAPAAASIQRLLPAQAGQVTLVAAARQTPGTDSFTVSGGAGAIRVEGTSPATLLTGVGWYLRHVAGVDIGFPADSTSRLPATLPAVATPFTEAAVVPHRYALNDTDNGYSGAYRTFADYQHEIDVLALHGFNEVLVTVGAEQPYYQALQQFGYTAADLRSWIPGPAHQPWWLLQNMSGFAGPVTDQLINSRAALGRQLCDQLRGLGMTPVLPGFYGTVPTDFATRNPSAHVVPQGTWLGFERESWLDPTGPVFTQLAAAYYAAQRTAFGDSAMYKMDPLHEGGSAGNVNVTSAATAIQQALLTAHPGATWAILGWGSNPSSTLLAGVDKSKMLIVDGYSDRYGTLDRETSWGGTPYAFGTIPNFGGKSTFGANTAAWTATFQRWLTKSNSAERGIAYMPEGTGTDPAAFALFADLAWSGSAIDQAAWFRNYADSRYGAPDANAVAAWDQLRQGPYSMPANGWSEPQDSLFTAKPSLTATTTAAWSPSTMQYDPTTVQRALASLLKVGAAQQATDAYRFDLVNTARQALDNRSRVLLPQINNAYTAKDLTTFRSLVSEWNADEALLDRITATDSRFLTGTWLANVPAGMQFDARSLITAWGDRPQANTGVFDYAAREYSGMINDLYAKRWAAYFASLDTALTTNTAPAAIDFFAMDDAWAKSTNSYPTTPTGDPVTVATAIAAALPPAPNPGPVTGIGGKCVDVTNGNSADGTPLQLWTCNGTAAQKWTVVGDGTVRADGKCMDVRGGATAAGTVVQLWSCNGTPAQSWFPRPDGTLRNTKSNLCLDAAGGGSAAGTGLIVWNCTANPNQRWNLPS
ncbi:alpha-N-acetylglucosaminidase C-terminal domain-containing protein [Kitasatospora sp. NA04385]|uniref:alpha-N-acetylglucosaminidase n=1 Tax=Kitasatospora sp. NA04385 TaxID=2742135 RepID=UPI00159175DA|nr:alpha-N-acetylglucosaminidase [Kitasatospora sp. NA04385]QKW18319.1 alpha-N-acetylglucosaminidase C-terminal domain-containing protein [Kitasatospora sp. NA04385]